VRIQVGAAQALLAVVAELKHLALLYDVDAAAGALQVRAHAVQAQQAAALTELAALRPLLDDLLLHCEAALAPTPTATLPSPRPPIL
jgi:hypothetical protein